VRGRLIALALLAGIIVPASSALAAALPHNPRARPGSIGIRLVDAPADSPGSRAGSYIVGRLAPGTITRRRVEITNSTRSIKDVAVYPAAASLRRGMFEFARSHRRNELSSWTSVSRAVLHLRPGTKAFETVTISVPKKASSGQRYAVIWAEVSAQAAAGITLVNRVGIRMYLSIGSGGAPPSNFAIGPLSAELSATGVPLVAAEIHNTGQRALEVRGNLKLSKGPGALRAGPYPVKLGTALAPEHSEHVTVRLDKRLPRGPWRANLKLRSGAVERAAVATITFPRYAGAVRPPIARVVPAGSHRLILVALLLVLLASAALTLQLFRRSALLRRRL
jgi:hypothetical protein